MRDHAHKHPRGTLTELSKLPQETGPYHREFLVKDEQQRCGYRPALIETFMQGDRFQGVYRLFLVCQVLWIMKGSIIGF